jgi:hypothetical protein
MSKPYSIVFNFEDPQQLAAAANMLANLHVQPATVQPATVQTATVQPAIVPPADKSPYDILAKKHVPVQHQPAGNVATELQQARKIAELEECLAARTQSLKWQHEARAVIDKEIEKLKTNLKNEQLVSNNLRHANADLQKQVSSAKEAAKEANMHFVDQVAKTEKLQNALELTDQTFANILKIVDHAADCELKKTLLDGLRPTKPTPVQLIQFDNTVSAEPTPVQPAFGDDQMAIIVKAAEHVDKSPISIIKEAQSKGATSSDEIVAYADKVLDAPVAVAVAPVTVQDTEQKRAIAADVFQPKQPEISGAVKIRFKLTAELVKKNEAELIAHAVASGCKTNEDFHKYIEETKQKHYKSAI